MKKQLLFAAGILLSSAGYAQVSKGTISVQGNLGFGSSTTTAAVTNVKTTRSIFFVQPGVGYFFADKLETYVIGSFDVIASKENGKTQTGTGFGAGAGIRRYFMLSEKFAFVAGPQFYYDQQEDFQKIKTQNIDVTLNAGFAFFPTKHIGIRAGLGSLGFSSSTSQEKNATAKTKTSTFGLQASSTDFSLGFSFYF